MFAYQDVRMRQMQARFEQLQQWADAAFNPYPRFVANHRSEIYKAIIKTLVVEDGELVDAALSMVGDKFDGAAMLIYPMLHLANDTNERGFWHRDGDSDTRRVFWMPLTPYNYGGLSFITWSTGMLSKALAFAGSRFLNLDGIASKLKVAPDTYYAWSPRMIHRGNLNTSDKLSAALVIFLDSTSLPTGRATQALDQAAVTDRVAAIVDAVKLDANGNIESFDETRLACLSARFLGGFYPYFKLRTGIELRQWRPA